jgi:hypothetical protein
MQTIKALREFEYQSKKYLKGTSYTVHDTVAEYLIYRNLAVLVSVEPDTNVMQGETKELKKETVKKPFPVSKRK